MSEPAGDPSTFRLPQRIWIVGHTGSGKSTLARVLARRIGLEPTHLDDIFWQPRWQGLGEPEFRERVRAVVSRPEWVIDGNYKAVRRLFWDRAELVIWLDLPLSVTFPRVAWRTFSRMLTREQVCNGNRESLATTLFSKHSILWWSLSMHGSQRRRYENETAGRNVVRLRSQREIGEWLRRIDHAPAVRVS